MIIGEFCDVYPPHLDGVGMVVRSYAQELSKTQEACYYIAPKNSAKKFPGGGDGFPVIRYASLPIPNEAYRLGIPGVDLTYNLDLKKIDFDLVHAHTPFTAGLEAQRIAAERKIPVVGTFHSKYYDDVYQKTRSETITKAVVSLIVSFYERCDEVWTVNEATADVLRGYGYRGEIVIMPNGTNLWYPTDADKKRAEERFGLGDGSVFLFVGQQNFKKNTDSILKAAALLKKTGANFKIVFAGQGPDAEKMHALSEELGLSGCAVFTGHLADRETLMGLYARSDVFVFPSLYDNAPMVVREAAAAGTPSILIEGSCAAEGVTDGVNGFLCKNTPDDIAAAMQRSLLTAKEVGERARETIPKPWSRIMEDVVERYDALIRRRKQQAI